MDLPITNPQGTDKEMLDSLLRETFSYFINEVNKENGLIADKTEKGSPSSIAAVGLGLSCYIVGIERGLISRAEGIAKILCVLRFFSTGRQGTEPDAMGYKGFYYHFLDMQTGQRVWDCELSTIDSAFFIAGALTAACYFTSGTKEEKEIRDLADGLYRRMDWTWALNNSISICHGWKPESGFLSYYWNFNYSEAHLLYMLALGSPTFPIPKEGYQKWTATFACETFYGIEYLHAGPLFIHQLSHIWINFQEIKDDFNDKTGFDYFENSRRATYVQRQYAIENKVFDHYGKNCWGLTACDGPGPDIIEINGKKFEFFDYLARGVPFGPDDGTVSAWAVVASLPFAPEIVIDTIRYAIERFNLKPNNWDGFDASFNPAYPVKEKNPHGWVSPWKFGLNQGPTVLMIENFQSGLLWNITKNIPYIVNGLRRAGFRGGWLENLIHS